MKSTNDSMQAAQQVNDCGILWMPILAAYTFGVTSGGRQFVPWLLENIYQDQWDKDIRVQKSIIKLRESSQVLIPTGVALRDYPADTTLNTFIRRYAHLTATKFMCLEGGCGVCVCVIKGQRPSSKEVKTWATNSCLTLLFSCDGWEVITAEGVGNRKIGYHPIQTQLAKLNGSQCGYCSPAMVMNMYSLLESKDGQITPEEIENSFGGNICRCTGYRPILEAMKSFGNNRTNEFYKGCRDIEDLTGLCSRTKLQCNESCGTEMLHAVLQDAKEWIQAKTIEDLFQAFKKTDGKEYMLVAGNTAHGVYRRSSDIQIFIDINNVPELHAYLISENEIQLGGNISLAEAMTIFQEVSTKSGFEFCSKVYNHLDLVANVPVRNMGTLAGNLSIKHQYKEFPSDIFIILEALDAQLCIIGPDSKLIQVTLNDYLSMDMKHKVILRINIASRPETEYCFNSYKIMPRAQNAHAFVNAAFLLQINNDIIKTARICFGGINPNFSHAEKTENFLIGKNLFTNDTIRGAISELEKELQPDWILPDASPEYRRILACGLFYKFVLGLAPEGKVMPCFKSGGQTLSRPISRGTQVFDTRKDMYPVTKPVSKVEGLVQCAGEATYMNDLPPFPGELWAAFVNATEVHAKIVQIDPSNALNTRGVVAFLSAKDVPGKNLFIQAGVLGFIEDELLFCNDVVQYHSQPLGIIIAESPEVATMASNAVKVMYEKSDAIVMPTMEEVFKFNARNRIQTISTLDTTKSKRCFFQQAKLTSLQGNFDIGGQYHYTMEPQTCVCTPTEDGMDVYTTSQWMDLTQTSISNCTGINKSKIILHVRRLGGGFGAKISRNTQIACACALACQVLGKPIRFVQSLESMMSSLGKRFACHSDYKVDVDEKGKIYKLTNNFYEDCGITINEHPIDYLTTITAKNCYNADENWKIYGKAVKTDAPSHTWCRAPGAVEGIAMIEHIMEHIAYETSQDPADVRMRNLKAGNKMRKLLPDFLKSSEYAIRRGDIINFNKNNRWCKKGLGLALMQYPIEYFGTHMATVVIYQGDGSVSISHGGIEMGQGLNTKATQVAAYVLGVPMDMIRIHPSDSFNGANAAVTGGGIGSEAVCYSVKKACEELLSRMKPFRESMKNSTWLDVVQKCFAANVSLAASHTHKAGDLMEYNVWGLCLAEVEVDILTGNLLITRVDILEDTGESLSPSIDVGQIEGAFVMGVGYWLTEKLVFNRQTGELLTNRTWNYKPPGAKDIPIDFRITLLQNSPNPAGFLRSKTTGEPATCLAIAVLFALRFALNSARNDGNAMKKWFPLGAPTTPEETVLNSGTSTSMFTLL